MRLKEAETVRNKKGRRKGSKQNSKEEQQQVRLKQSIKPLSLAQLLSPRPSVRPSVVARTRYAMYPILSLVFHIVHHGAPPRPAPPFSLYSYRIHSFTPWTPPNPPCLGSQSGTQSINYSAFSRSFMCFSSSSSRSCSTLAASSSSAAGAATAGPATCVCRRLF